MNNGSRVPSSTATSFFTGSFELEEEAKALEDYVVGQRLGEGAYGSVYVVKYLPSGDRFALKILQKQDLFTGSGIYSSFVFGGGAGDGAGGDGADASTPLGGTAVDMQAASAAAALVRSFEQGIVSEAMVMQSLEHPHVVKFYKFLNSTTAFYFVMELAEGGELFDLILSKNHFNEDEARMYFQQLISAIDYCHRNGVAHKDLKAENLLLSNDNRLLVCDFGFSSKVAKENIDDPEETLGTADNIALLDAIHNGSMFGTLHYSSPEAVLASSQQRDVDCLSCDDVNASARYSPAMPDTGYGTAQSGYPSQLDMAGRPGAGRICSSATPVSNSSSDSRGSSRSGSVVRRRQRHPHHRPHVLTVEGQGGAEATAAVGPEGSPRGLRGSGAAAAEKKSGMRRGSSGCLEEESVMVKTALEVVTASSPRMQDSMRGRPTPITPPPAPSGGNAMCHSSSTQSLASLASGSGKPHRKTSPTQGRSKVGEGFSSFVKALLGSGSPGSSSSHHNSSNHHHSSHHHHHSDPHGRASSPREKGAGASKAGQATMTGNSVNSRTTTVLAPLRSPTTTGGGAGGDSTLHPSSVHNGKATAGDGRSAHGSLRPTAAASAAAQEPASFLSSAVSSSTTSPTTASFNTNPSFAESTGRGTSTFAAALAVSSSASAARRCTLPPTSGSPTTRVSAVMKAAAGGGETTMTAPSQPRPTARDATARDATATPLTAKSSSGEELSGRGSLSPALAGMPHQRLPLPIESLSTTDPLLVGHGSPVLTAPVARKPPLVIVDPFLQDLWSAGVILFFMLTGRLPFDGRDDEETLHLIQTGDFAFDEDEAARISPAARRLVTRMLAKEPTDRPSTEQIIQDPWFQVGIQIAKDFPHREDLLQEAASRQRSKQQAAGPGGEVDEVGGVTSSSGASQEGVDGAKGSFRRGGAAATGVPSPAQRNAPSPSGERASAGDAAGSGGGSGPSGQLGQNPTSGTRSDKAASSTFLDFSVRHPVSAEEERVLATAFRKVDSDGFGCITRDQLRDMLTTLHGDAVPTGDVDELVRLFTGDASADHITFKQFRDAWVSKDLAHTQFTHSSEFQLANIIGTEMDAVERQVVRQLRTAFDGLDENHRGVIQLDQVRRVFERCQIPVTRDDCLSLIKYFHETEQARYNTRASKNWNRRCVTPAATPTTNLTPLLAGGATTPTPTAAAPTATTPSPTTQSTAGLPAEAPTSAAPQRDAPPPSPPPSPSPLDGVAATATSLSASPTNIAVSFESFVSGIVKSDILMKHPLGRKLAAATNLAAMFQSRNVTECVRHGFLVTGLQNVVLAKLASVPERLLLLYSDEVVSTTENIYSFRYLGSSALVAGATMSSATPLLLSTSLVAVSGSGGGAGGALVGGASLGPTAQLVASLHGGRSLSYRSVATTPPSSMHRRGPLNGSTAGPSASHSGPGLAGTPSLTAEGVLGGEYVSTVSNAGSLPFNSAPTVTDVNAMLSRSSKPADLRRPSSRTAVTRSDFLGSPSLQLDRCTADHLASSGASSSQPSPQQQQQQQQRSSAVPIPRHPSYQGSPATPQRPIPTVTAPAAPTGNASTSSAAFALTPSLSHSLPFSHSLRHTPSARGTIGGRDRRTHGADNDHDSAQDDTHSFFSASRHSSSIINTSEGSQSASDTALSCVLGEQQQQQQQEVKVAAQGGRRRSTIETVARKQKKTHHGKSENGRASPSAADAKASKPKPPTTPPSPSATSEAAAAPSKTAGTDGDGAQLAAHPAAAPRATTTTTTLTPQPSAAALTSSLNSPPSITQTNTGHFLPTPSANFTHRAMAYGGTGAVALVNGVCDVDVILSPACLGYTMVQFRRIHGKTSDFHEAVTYISNLLESEREQAMEDTLTRGESELM